ncbi:hypothetical protein GCM10027174_07300 [Salinifilum aidingensis]
MVRADAERTAQAVLEAAERVLSADPTATMERIAEAAGVARTTVHRRFASREALVDAMVGWAARRFSGAVDAARPESAPPLVALYQVTVNLLEVKIGWGYAVERMDASSDPEVQRLRDEVQRRCGALFQRARQAGVLRADCERDWTRRAYFALLREAADEGRHGGDVDALSTRVVDTLLRGLGTDGLGTGGPGTDGPG